jgi:hypothetical protein
MVQFFPENMSAVRPNTIDLEHEDMFLPDDLLPESVGDSAGSTRSSTSKNPSESADATLLRSTADQIGATRQNMSISSSEVTELSKSIAVQAAVNSVNAVKLKESIASLAALGSQQKESFDVAMGKAEVAHEAQAVFNYKNKSFDRFVAGIDCRVTSQAITWY